MTALLGTSTTPWSYSNLIKARNGGAATSTQQEDGFTYMFPLFVFFNVVLDLCHDVVDVLVNGEPDTANGESGNLGS